MEQELSPQSLLNFFDENRERFTMNEAQVHSPQAERITRHLKAVNVEIS